MDYQCSACSAKQSRRGAPPPRRVGGRRRRVCRDCEAKLANGFSWEFLVLRICQRRRLEQAAQQRANPAEQGEELKAAEEE